MMIIQTVYVEDEYSGYEVRANLQPLDEPDMFMFQINKRENGKISSLGGIGFTFMDWEHLHVVKYSEWYHKYFVLFLENRLAFKLYEEKNYKIIAELMEYCVNMLTHMYSRPDKLGK